MKEVTIAQHVVNVSVIVIKTSSDCRLCSLIRDLVSTEMCNVPPFSAVGNIIYQMFAWVCTEERREREGENEFVVGWWP